jgi:biotin synthase
MLAESGWRVSSGFITGLPDQPFSELEMALDLADQLPLSGCSVSPFVPGESTPYADEPTSDLGLTLNCIASLRHAHPDWVIPAVSAFNLAAKDGYRQGIRAGANLTTINVTPEPFRKDYVIYKRDRFIMSEERVLDAIEKEGLVPSTESLAEHYSKRDQVVAASSV